MGVKIQIKMGMKEKKKYFCKASYFLTIMLLAIMLKCIIANRLATY